MSGTKQTAVKTSEGKAPREVLGSAPRQPQPKFKIKVNKIGKGKTGSGRRFKSGRQALKSLKRYGTATAPPIPESSFSQLVNDILSKCGTTRNGTPYGIQSSALQTLKKAAEDTIVLEMRLMNAFANPNNRVTLRSEDMTFAKIMIARYAKAGESREAS